MYNQLCVKYCVLLLYVVLDAFQHSKPMYFPTFNKAFVFYPDLRSPQSNRNMVLSVEHLGCFLSVCCMKSYCRVSGLAVWPIFPCKM